MPLHYVRIQYGKETNFIQVLVYVMEGQARRYMIDIRKILYLLKHFIQNAVSSR